MLVVAAHPKELEAFESLGLGGLEFHPVGVGLLSASAGAESLFSRTRTRCALLVGSVGSYGEAELESLVIAQSTQLVDPALLAEDSELPALVSLEAEFDPSLTRGLASVLAEAKVASVATTLGITVSDALASTLALGQSCDFENLEALAVAQAARRHRIRLGAIFGVTNRVGSQGRRQWAERHASVAHRVAGAFETWWNKGHPGL